MACITPALECMASLLCSRDYPMSLRSELLRVTRTLALLMARLLFRLTDDTRVVVVAFVEA